MHIEANLIFKSNRLLEMKTVSGIQIGINLALNKPD